MSHQGARPGPGPVRHAEGSSCMDIGWVWEKVETTPYFVVQGVAVWPHLGPWLVSQVSGCRISRCGGGGGSPRCPENEVPTPSSRGAWHIVGTQRVREA